MTNMAVGTKVRAKRAFPSIRVDVGDIGFVYEAYSFGEGNALHEGVSIIFEKGGYDGFSIDEQQDYLEDLGIDRRYENYKFTGVVSMYADYLDGFWKFKE